MTTNVKSKLFKAEKTQWVIPCNPAYYDVCGVFNKLDKVEIVGYTYDDIGSKINIDVDLKANSADVVKN